MKEVETERAGRTEQAVPAHAVVASISPAAASVLALQRTAGNRAVSSVVARRRLQREATAQTVQVNEHVVEQLREGMKPYEWDAAFEAEIWDDQLTGVVNIRLVPMDVSEDEASRVRQETRKEFQRLFDSKFVITEEIDWGFDKDRLLRLGINFLGDSAEERPHATVELYKGSGHDNRGHWYMASDTTTHAHEAAHLFGLLDEYIDVNVPTRESAAAPGVHEDNSIMGNYVVEGAGKAEMKARHALRIAKFIFKAAGKPGAKLTAARKK